MGTPALAMANGAQSADAAAYERLMHSMLSANNDERQQAEQQFAAAKKQPDACVSSLTALLRTSQNTETRSFASVLLRRVCNGRLAATVCGFATDTVRQPSTGAHQGQSQPVAGAVSTSPGERPVFEQHWCYYLNMLALNSVLVCCRGWSRPSYCKALGWSKKRLSFTR